MQYEVSVIVLKKSIIDADEQNEVMLQNLFSIVDVYPSHCICHKSKDHPHHDGYLSTLRHWVHRVEMVRLNTPNVATSC